MPKVIITPSSIFNPIGVRLLLGEVGVIGPMYQDETTITCIMTEAQIERFRNGRGAAHKVEIVPDAPPQSLGTIEDVQVFDRVLTDHAIRAALEEVKNDPRFEGFDSLEREDGTFRSFTPEEVRESLERNKSGDDAA